MIVFYPIKPIYVENILSGGKIFELRRRLPAKNLGYVLLYSTSPVCKIVGYADVKKTYKKSVEAIWKLVSKKSGISKKDYFLYFEGCEDACAIEMSSVRKFSRPFSVDSISSDFSVPQSFCYIEENDFKRLITRKSVAV